MISRLRQGLPHVLYPNGYVWFVFVSALDIMLTWMVLHAGGFEANVLANNIIWRYGLPGLVTFKFALVIFVICLCEIVGRRKTHSGKVLLTGGIVITCMPVALAMILLLTRE